MRIKINTETAKRMENVVHLKDDEQYLHAFSKSGKFYIVAVVKGSSSIKIYEYDLVTDNMRETPHDFSSDISRIYKNTSLWE